MPSGTRNSAVEHWQRMIQEEHSQSEKTRGTMVQSSDFWEDRVSYFLQDPHRINNPYIETLTSKIDRTQTVLDVGAGAGRLALPLARHCQHVTAIEPSESMAQGLLAGRSKAGITNLTLVKSTWEKTTIPASNIVLCAHVLYTILDVVKFVQKLETHALERVLLILHLKPPQSHLESIWRYVHQEERLRLPALPELLEVLREIGIYPDLEMLPTADQSGWATREQAHKDLRKRLYVSPGTRHDKRLEQAMDKFLKNDGTIITVMGTEPGRPGLLSWSPSLRN